MRIVLFLVAQPTAQQLFTHINAPDLLVDSTGRPKDPPPTIRKGLLRRFEAACWQIPLLSQSQ